MNEYDVAAGMALMRGAGGVVLDAEGKAVELTGTLERRLSGCFAGSPGAAAQLAAHDWKSLEREPSLKGARSSASRAARPEARVDRAQACLLGQVIGDSLGSLVEFKDADEIARLHPGGVRELADGGVYHTIAGQPTDDSEMALALARTWSGSAPSSPKGSREVPRVAADAPGRHRRDHRARAARTAHHR